MFRLSEGLGAYRIIKSRSAQRSRHVPRAKVIRRGETENIREKSLKEIKHGRPFSEFRFNKGLFTKSSHSSYRKNFSMNSVFTL